MTYVSEIDEALNDLIGKKVTSIHINADNLVIKTSDGFTAPFYVYGDCCSQSYLEDFQGVEKLLNNGPITEWATVDLSDKNGDDGDEYGNCLQYYGYSFTTVHDFWGEQTSVFSFRNESNGYYGGSLALSREIPDLNKLKSITEDWKCD